MRYEEITGWNDIVGGAGGAKDTAKEAVGFLNYWFADGAEGGEAGVFIQLLNLITKFFNDLKELFK